MANVFEIASSASTAALGKSEGGRAQMNRSKWLI